MKVLWFNVTVPGRYKNDGEVIAGWQDSLENIVRAIPEIDLEVAFEANLSDVKKTVDGVTYHPIPMSFSLFEKIQDRFSWKPRAEKMVKGALEVISEVKPDLIHIFGTEWPWGLVAKSTEIPVVIHMQGALIPYINALYPPCYSYASQLFYSCMHPKEFFNIICSHNRSLSWVKLEYETWKHVNNYMGRTCWDKAVVNTLHPGAHYFHVDEALRPTFFHKRIEWRGYENQRIKLITTGCSTFWKGPDMMLKTAYVLKQMGIDFEWKVAGEMSSDVKKMVERREKMKFEDNGIIFLGYTKPDELIDILCDSSIYVHTAYIENSPNSICEAQMLGLPIVSTHVGGIETLLQEIGVLVPANDPWQMAYAICELASDKKRMLVYSETGKRIAIVRHTPKNIAENLISCYNSVVDKVDRHL